METFALALAQNVLKEALHVLVCEYALLPSGSIIGLQSTTAADTKKSFIPVSVALLNTQR